MEHFEQKIKEFIRSGTPAQRRIARYFSENLHQLPFETAASVAEKLELNPLTVGRFVRSLGYHGLEEIKNKVKQNSLAVRLLTPVQRNEDAEKSLAAQVAEQIETLHHIHNLASRPEWMDAVTALLASSKVVVFSHPEFATLSRHFCARLQSSRDHVDYVDGMNIGGIELAGHQADVLVVVIDSPQFVNSALLVRSARRSGYNVLQVTTGHYRERGPGFAHITLAIPLRRDDGQGKAMAMITLLEFVAVSVGKAAKQIAIRA